MGQTRERMVADLALRGLAKFTCEAYLFRAFVALTGIDADRCVRCGSGRLVRQPLDGRPTPSCWDTS